MTYPQFVQQLSETPRDWLDTRESFGQFIRRRPGGWSTCPICAVAGWPGQNGLSAAEAIGLSRDDASRIIDAADGCYGHDPNVRRDLLRACGLTESA